MRNFIAFTPLILIFWPPLYANPSLIPSLTSRADKNEIVRPDSVPADQVLEQRKVRIGSIKVIPQNIFATDREVEDTLLFRLGNLLHIPTRPDTIHQQLLFRPGDLYQARLLRENERQLRQLSYLGTASITPVHSYNQLVDLEIHTTDVWTLKPGLSFSRSGGENTGGIEFEELNLLGKGDYLRVSLLSGVDRDTRGFAYRNRNLRGSWWHFSGSYYDNSDGDAAAFSLKQPFQSSNATSSSGISLKTFDRIVSSYDLGKILSQHRVEETTAQLFQGWSSGIKNHWVTRYRAGLTLDHKRFSATPDTNLAVPDERKLSYPWVSVEHFEDAWQTVNNRNQIGKLEDFSLGWRFTALAGFAHPEFGSDRNSLITRFTVKKGIQPSARQNLQLNFFTNGRYEHSQWQNLRAGGSLRFYHHHSPRVTSYAAANLLSVKNPDADSQIMLGGDSGLRGYPLRYQSGEGRWLLTLEQRYFTNWYPFRLFHLGAAVFADIGGTHKQALNKSEPLGTLKDVGFGLRLGNSRSGLGNVIHLDFAFPLGGDEGIDDWQFLLQTKSSF